MVDEGLRIRRISGPILESVLCGCWDDDGEEGERSMYHEKSPDGVVEEDGRGEDEHCEAYYSVELARRSAGIACHICWGRLQRCLLPLFDIAF